MVFSSSLFILFFLPIFLLVYHIVPKKWKNYVILLTSIIFYAWGGPKFIFVILCTTIITFYLVQFLSKSTSRRKRRWLLFFSVFVNLIFLLYFKYANFFVENVNATIQFLGYKPMKWIEVVLPIGISFYTFQTITYALDVYRKVHQPLRKVTDYILYIMAFPQMIAGPIVRFNSIADQIIDRKETIDDKLIGFYRFVLGLSKKILIANVMAEQADAIFNSNLANLSTPNAWIGILAYTFQIYFDFSGYSDMAIGLGKMMGFNFPENFDSPYSSRSISEFWRRWHITLGTFMKDYLYIPLGGNRVSVKRMYLNLGIVFLLSGLWHGASWNFVLWGAFHGLFLILDRIFLLKLLDRLGSFFSTLFTFFVVMIGWVIFRIENFSDIFVYLEKMFCISNSQASMIIPQFYIIGLLAIVFSFLASFGFGKRIIKYFFIKEDYTISQHINLTLLSTLLFIISLSFILSSDFNPFIYYRF